MDAKPLLGKLNTRAGMAAVLAVVALFSAALYLPTTHYDFVWDDAILITHNSSLIHARPAEILARGFWAGSPQGMSGPSASYYRPLVTLSLSLNLSGSHADPWWFHRVNVMLYALAAVAVTLVLWELLHSGVWALLGGLLFAAHSSHVESVAFVSGRTDILLTLFIGIAAFALLRSLRQHNRWWWLVVLAAFGCALLSKETAVLFPLLVALAPLLVGVRYDRRYWLLVLAVLTVLGGYFLLRAGAVPALVPFDTQTSLPSRLAAVADTFGLYVRMFFWPSPHRAWYEAGAAPLIQAPHMIAAVLFVASALLFALWRRFRSTLWGYAWTVAFLLPVTSIAAIGPTAAERLLMLPSAGLVMVVITALARLPEFRGGMRGAAAVGCGMVVVLLGADTLTRTRIWRSNETLFTAMVREAPTAPSAYIGLGDAIAERQPDSALALYQHVLRLDPDNVHARLNAAIILSDRGDQRGAIAYLRSARALDPKSDIILNNLALAFRDAGEIDSALVAIDRSIAVNPHGTPALHLNRASVLMTAGRVAEAAEEYRRALAQDSTLAGARPELADILQRRGQYDSAIALMQREVAYRPAAASFAMLGDLFISTGDSARAWDSYSQALRADQSYVPALYNLAVMSAARGNIAGAKVLAERAYRLQPDLEAVSKLYFQFTRRPGSAP
jgi:Tfp pilus assembly protein PilF